MKLVMNLLTKAGFGVLLGIVSWVVFAESGTISSIAGTIQGEATAIARLLSVTSYVAGVGFALAGILQFKAHKENPQQVPLSRPVVMMVVATCLLFLPTILTVAGSSLFGEGQGTSAAQAAGVQGLSGQ